MALSVAEANAVSSANYDPTLSQITFQSSPLWAKLKKKNKVQVRGGADLRWTIRYQDLDYADAVSARQQITFEQKETRTQAVLDWKYYNAKTMVSWDERVKNTGKPQIINLMGDKATELKEDMENRFATDLFTANPNGNGFEPLTTIVDSASSYAGIAVADAANWASIEDGSTTTLNLYGSNSLSYLVNQATFGNKMPDFHLTTRDLASKAESLIEPQKRYYDEELADMGFKSVTFHGAPIVGDPKCTAALWLGLCLDVLEIWVHPDFDMVITPWKELFQAGFPNSMAKVMSWAGNIVCRNRKPMFKATALDYTL